MSLHADLLIQAEQLAQQDPRRPKQANLRLCGILVHLNYCAFSPAHRRRPWPYTPRSREWPRESTGPSHNHH